MPTARRVESARNPLVRELSQLKQRAVRERSGLMLVEGAREAQRAVEAQLEARRLVLCPELWPAGAEAELEELRRVLAERGTEVLLLSRPAFERLSLRASPDGVALVAAQPPHELSRLRLPAAPLVLVLDGLEKPGNVGALLRTADAAGVDAVVLTGDGTDLANPNVIRASMGSVFAVSVAVAPADRARAWLATAGLRLVATAPSASRAHWDASFAGPTAVVLGSEHAGLPPAWLQGADERIRIPMRPRAADSLNVAVAGAVVLFEALRQRRAHADAGS